jgi:hypothetical protein
MNRAELLNDLRVFLADASEGSFTFSDEACWAALEKAQEQCAATLGLTYTEPSLAVDGNNEVEIPIDAISVVRVEVGHGTYSISVSPEHSVIEGPDLTLSVSITRSSGHTDPITTRTPAIQRPDEFFMYVNGEQVYDFDEDGRYVLANAPDSYTMQFGGNIAWMEAWSTGVTVEGNDGSGPVDSSVFYVSAGT